MIRWWQPITCRNGLLWQLNMVFSRQNILSRIARIRITASLTFDQKNIFVELKLLASCSEVDADQKCHKEVTIIVLTEKKLRSQITGMIGSLYALTNLAHATSSCYYRLPQRKLSRILDIADFRPALCHCASPFSCSLRKYFPDNQSIYLECM